jgi:hypothetical protein
VWLDGVYAGAADDFDGQPDFLYLEPGVYQLEFRLNGYETYGVDLDVSPGERVNLRSDMRRTVSDVRTFGPSRGPMASSRMFEPGGRAVEPRERSGAAIASDGDNRRIVSGQIHEEPRADGAERMPASGGNVARLRIQVTPDDSVVYLDDRLLGTGEELSARSRGVRTTAGKHSIRVIRPGFKMKALEVEAVGGRTTDVVIVLER